MKRSMLLIFVTLFLTACGGPKDVSDLPKDAYQVEFSETPALAQQRSNNVCIVKEKMYFTGSTEDAKQDVIYVSLSEDEYKSEEEIVRIPEGEHIIRFAVTEEGELYVAVQGSGEQNGFLLCRYTHQGQCEWQVQIENISFVKDIFCTKTGDIVVASDALVMQYTNGGKLVGELELSDSMPQYLCMPESGAVYLCREYGKETELIEVKLSDLQFGNRFSVPEGQRVLKTNEGIYTTDGDSLYHYEEEKKEFVKGLSLSELNIDGMSINTIAKKEAGGYIVCFATEGTLGNLETALIEEKDITEDIQTPAVEKNKIRFATASTTSMYRNAMVTFNRNSDLYEIEIPKYPGNDERSELIKLSFLSEEAPDIVEMAGGFDQGAYQSYAESGYLAELTDFMDKSDSVKTSDFLPKVLDDFTVDGRIYGLPVSFSIYTLACPSEALGGKSSWTIEEFLDFLEMYPGAFSFPFATAEDIKLSIFQACMYHGLVAFVDWENGTATFNGERFKNILNRIRNLEVYTTVEEDEIRSLNGEVIISTLHLDDVRQLQQAEWRNGHGKDLTLIGFPGGEEDAKSGGIVFYDSQLGINLKTSVADGAWSFVESELKKAFEASDNGFPTGSKAFEEKLNEETGVSYEVDGVPFPAITTRQMEEIRKATESMFVYRMEERELIGMIQTEAMACFDKSKTVEDAAGIIQNRVQLYLDERK